MIPIIRIRKILVSSAFPDSNVVGQTELCQAFLVKKTGEPPPPFSRTALPQTKACGERPNNNFATLPPSKCSHKSAHQGPGLGVPDLHEPDSRPADDAIPIRGEINRTHPARLARHPRHPQALRVPDEFLNPLLILPHGANACAGARVPERMHLPIKPASALKTPPTSARPVRFPGLLDCHVSVHTCTHTHLTPLPRPKPQKKHATSRKPLSRSCFWAWS